MYCRWAGCVDQVEVGWRGREGSHSPRSDCSHRTSHPRTLAVLRCPQRCRRIPRNNLNMIMFIAQDIFINNLVHLSLILFLSSKRIMLVISLPQFSRAASHHMCCSLILLPDVSLSLSLTSPHRTLHQFLALTFSIGAVVVTVITAVLIVLVRILIFLQPLRTGSRPGLRLCAGQNQQRFGQEKEEKSSLGRNREKFILYRDRKGIQYHVSFSSVFSLTLA